MLLVVMKVRIRLVYTRNFEMMYQVLE